MMALVLLLQYCVRSNIIRSLVYLLFKSGWNKSLIYHSGPDCNLITSALLYAYPSLARRRKRSRARETIAMATLKLTG